jgi:hypothetical protein
MAGITHADAADGTFSATGSTNWNKAHVFGIASAGMPYTFDTATGGSPATGTIQFNSATPASITTIYLHETDAYGYAVDSRIDSLSGGDMIQIYSVDNEKYMMFQCNGEFKSGASIDPVPVVFLYGSATVFSASEKLFIRIDDTGTSMMGARMQLALCNYLL